MPIDADGIIRPNFKVGDKVDYVYRGVRGGSGPGGQWPIQGALAEKIKAHDDKTVKDAFSNALEEKEGTRKRAQIDAIVSEEEIRLIIEDTGDIVWAHPSEIEPVDAVSALGDIVGSRSKSLQDGLEEIEDEEVVCADCAQKIEGMVWWAVSEARCTPCRNKKLGLE